MLIDEYLMELAPAWMSYSKENSSSQGIYRRFACIRSMYLCQFMWHRLFVIIYGILYIYIIIIHLIKSLEYSLFICALVVKYVIKKSSHIILLYIRYNCEIIYFKVHVILFIDR